MLPLSFEYVNAKRAVFLSTFDVFMKKYQGFITGGVKLHNPK